MVCSQCSNFQPPTLKGLKGEQRAILWTTMKDLTQARLDGCIHCSLVIDALTAYKPIWSTEDNAFRVEMQLARGKPLRIFYRKDALYLEVFRPQHSLTSLTEDLSDAVGSAIQVTNYSGAPECFKLARSWLAECMATHKRCDRTAESVLPTRVLAIDGDDGNPSIRLVDGLGRRGSYVALSYCWGPIDVSRVCRTVTDNVSDHQRGINVQALSKTLQHAVEITAKMGFSYLWVDALCIIQDDTEDWTREASKMSEVYSGAALTILAAGSSSSADGIYQYHQYSRCHRLSYRGSDVLVRPQLVRQHTQYSELASWSSALDPIHLRAWTLQEIVLSNRALVYSGQELKWYCNQLRRCECAAADALPGYDSDLRSEADIGTSFRRKDDFDQQTAKDAYAPWSQVVPMFSNRMISYEQDRLVAISGLARRFADFLQDSYGRQEQYLAGLWANSLPMSLLWITDASSDLTEQQKDLITHRPASWRAPSWSWAALEGVVVCHPHVGMQPIVRVISAATVAKTADPFGQVSWGSLTLAGRVLHNISAVPSNQGSRDTRDANRELSPMQFVRLDHPLQLKSSEAWLCYFKPDLLGDVVTNAAELTMIEIGRIVLGTYNSARKADYQYAFMVLKSVPGQAVFERVGVAEYRGFDLQPVHRDAAERVISGAVEQVLTII